MQGLRSGGGGGRLESGRTWIRGGVGGKGKGGEREGRTWGIPPLCYSVEQDSPGRKWGGEGRRNIEDRELGPRLRGRGEPSPGLVHHARQTRAPPDPPLPPPLHLQKGKGKERNGRGK